LATAQLLARLANSVYAGNCEEKNMLNNLKQLFLRSGDSEEPRSSSGAESTHKREQMATCAVLIEIANSDSEFADVEKDLIMRLIKDEYELSDNEVSELMELSHQSLDDGTVTSVEFIEIINRDFSSDQKIAVLKNLWRLVLVDKRLDSFEDFYLRHIEKSLGVSAESAKATEEEVRKEMEI
jgi:uncharacterized tellurite resistance protein B-like protein